MISCLFSVSYNVGQSRRWSLVPGRWSLLRGPEFTTGTQKTLKRHHFHRLLRALCASAVSHKGFETYYYPALFHRRPGCALGPRPPCYAWGYEETYRPSSCLRRQARGPRVRPRWAPAGRGSPPGRRTGRRGRTHGPLAAAHPRRDRRTRPQRSGPAPSKRQKI